MTPGTGRLGARYGFTDRFSPGGGPEGPLGGNLAGHVGDDPAAVTARRGALLALTGGTRLCFVSQVHGSDVAVAPDGAAAGVVELGTADALVTAAPGTALAVVVADCLPVLLADPVAGVVGAAHAGRPGLLAGVLPATVSAMCRLGADPAQVRAVVGPGICGRCYEVPAGLQREVASVLPGSRATTSWGTPSLDLPAAAVRQLRGLGVVAEVDGRCTRGDHTLFSYRRDGRTGRFAGWVVRE